MIVSCQDVRQPKATEKRAAAPRRLDIAIPQAARLRPSDCAVPLVSGVLLVMRIVDVFVRDTLKGSYPVVVECQGRPAEDEFVDQVRNGMDRGFYSADDVKVAKFVVREAGGRQAGLNLGLSWRSAQAFNVLGNPTEEDTWRERALVRLQRPVPHPFGQTSRRSPRTHHRNRGRR